MTDNQGTQGNPFDMDACVAMMEKVMAQMSARCDCAEMMPRITSQAEQGCCDWCETMSDMAASCCGAQDEPKSEAATETTRQA